MGEGEGTGISVFRYDPPEIDKGKKNVKLVRSELISAGVQCVTEGGENNLHSHTGQDGFWFVLRGKAAFYGEGEDPIAEVGPNEGVLVPRNTPYWFESCGSDTLEILHVSGLAKDVPDRRVDLRDRTDASRNAPE